MKGVDVDKARQQ
jgi:hypothetical protein